MAPDRERRELDLVWWTLTIRWVAVRPVGAHHESAAGEIHEIRAGG
jgi:hypothetical protein